MAKVSRMDDLGVKRYKTKQEAISFEQKYKKISGASDMTFDTFVELYLKGCSHHLTPVSLC